MAEGVVAGIDRASEVHVACVMDGDGAATGRFSFTHDAAAIRAMVRRLGSAGVAIERGDGPVVEELLGAGLAVFLVPSRQIKGLRTRYGSAGNKDVGFPSYRGDIGAPRGAWSYPRRSREELGGGSWV